MDTSLAEEKTQTMPTLAPDSFFFISLSSIQIISFYIKSDFFRYKITDALSSGRPLSDLIR